MASGNDAAKAGLPAKSRFAFTCFFPDWGHVQPLLKIAKAAQDAGHTVRCYVPEKSRAFADRAGLDSYILTSESPTGAEELGRLASRSLFFLNFSGYSHTNLFVYPVVMKSVVEQVDDIAADLEAFAPDVVVGDSHVLSQLYESLARSCGAEFILHNPSGTLAGDYRPYVRVYGHGAASGLEMTAVETAGSVFQKLYRPFFYFTHLGAWRASRAIKRRLGEAIAKVVSDAPAWQDKHWSLTTGLTWIENQFLGSGGASGDAGGRTNLPPLPSSPEAFSPELETWLAASPEKVIYLSFGSILKLSDADYAAIAQALKSVPQRVIWSMPVDEKHKIADLADPAKFFVTNYVPQAELLKRPEIACFVTHAGASSVQEALIGGAPLVCVPLHADNGYISSLMERLGVATRVWKQHLATPRFAAALREVLGEPRFAERAAEIAATLRDAQAQEVAVQALERVAASTTDRPSATWEAA